MQTPKSNSLVDEYSFYIHISTKSWFFLHYTSSDFYIGTVEHWTFLKGNPLKFYIDFTALKRSQYTFLLYYTVNCFYVSLCYIALHYKTNCRKIKTGLWKCLFSFIELLLLYLTIQVMYQIVENICAFLKKKCNLKDNFKF